jgi:osmotically-inducible protein OsmY
LVNTWIGAIGRKGRKALAPRAKKTKEAVEKGVGKSEQGVGKAADKTSDAVGKVGDKMSDTSVTTRVKADFSGEKLLEAVQLTSIRRITS